MRRVLGEDLPSTQQSLRNYNDGEDRKIIICVPLIRWCDKLNEDVMGDPLLICLAGTYAGLAAGGGLRLQLSRGNPAAKPR